MKNFVKLASFAVGLALTFSASAFADPIRQTKGSFDDRFRQLDPEDWPTPGSTRTASGAPGPSYWQQKVDYSIAVTLDEEKKRLSGTATVRYTNNSPDTLTYLWLHLDQNIFKKTSIAELTRTTAEPARIPLTEVRRINRMKQFDGGFTIAAVSDAKNAPLKYSVVDTLMRVNLAQPLVSGSSTEFKISWSNNIIETNVIGGRDGFECFTKPGEDGNCIFLGAQWFPRLAVYSDNEGWHNKSFLGTGEFTLEFGDYDVAITVPADFAVAATGELQNANEVLTADQRARLEAAKTALVQPVYIVTPAEAAAREKSKAKSTATWRFSAKNVRDFGWAGSRKFIWDAMAVKQPDGGRDVLAMSFFPKEADPLWSAYSTKSIKTTIDVYSRYSIPYPYPTAQSVNGPVGGMEYPMISFNGPRPVKDDKGNLTYTDRSKYGLISVVIHEVGHNYFPMIVNSDERQWTWMDEGMNTFLQYLTEQEWEPNYPSRRGDPKDITAYMLSEDQVPMMTQSDSVLQLGNNAYGKPATALVILRETILGREMFDTAFKEYSQRWAFKQPTPFDFFRTMEEASGTDLDWFWRGWFYSTEHVDISIDKVSLGTLNTTNPEIENPRLKGERDAIPEELTAERNRMDGTKFYSENDPSVIDFYTRTDPLTTSRRDSEAAAAADKAREPWAREALATKSKFYVMTFSNKGGVVMPVIVKVVFKDGTTETVKIPAEIWRRNSRTVNWTYTSDKEVISVELDPRYETADAVRSNNYYPPRIEPTRLDAYQDRQTGRNLMKDMDLKVQQNGVATLPLGSPP